MNEAQVLVPLKRNPDFMTLWTGQFASALGSSMSVLAFPLITLAVTGSARFAGLVGGASAVGAFLAGPFAGVLTDRMSRRHLIVWGNLLGAMLFATLAVAGFLHKLTAWHLVVIAGLSGLVSSLVSPALSASVRTVVPAVQRAEASAYANGRKQAVSLIGPPIGGALVPLGFGVPFLVDALSYLAAAVSTHLVKHPLAAPQRDKKPFWRDMGEGFTFLGSRPSLIGFCVRTALFNLGIAIISTATVIRLARAGVAPGKIGLVETIAALGGLAGSVVAAKVVNHLRTGWFAIVTGIALCVLLGSTAATESPWIVGFLFALGMFLMPASNAGVIGYFSHLVPDGLQGRFYGASGLIVGVLAPLGPVLAGTLVASAGGPTTVWTGSGFILASSVPLLVIRELRTLPAPDVWSTWKPMDDISAPNC